MPRLMLKRASLLATTLRGRSLPYKATLVERFKAEALPAISSGTVRACFDSCFIYLVEHKLHLCFNSPRIYYFWLKQVRRK